MLLGPPVVAVLDSSVLELPNYKTKSSGARGTFNFWALWGKVCRKFLESLSYSLLGVRDIICGTLFTNFPEAGNDAFDRVVGNSSSLCGTHVLDSWARQRQKR